MTAREQGRPIENYAKAAATVLSRPHLADQVQQEQQRAITHPGQTWSKATVKAHQIGFLTDVLLDLLPVHTKRWIGEHVIELLLLQAVVVQRVAKDDIADVLALDQHVGLANRVRFRVQLLAT